MPLPAGLQPQLEQILPASQLLTPSSPAYSKESLPWSLNNDKHPALVAVPRTEDELSALIRLVYSSAIEFAVRGTGVGNASARDLVISTSAFRDLVFDPASKTVEIGTGLTWGEVDTLLAKHAPGHVVVGARCPYVGVGGSTLMGGLSWLSHELGLGSDPHNLLDARIVLHDGRALWASAEPDLLWSLRGGGGNFGVVTRLRLRAHAYPTRIWTGMIRIHNPAGIIQDLSTKVAAFARREDPKLALHVFIVHAQALLHGAAAEPTIWLLPFDAHGAAHAQSEEGFKWALDLPGAEAQCHETDLPGVHALQASSAATHGQAESWLAAALVGDVDDQFLVRAWDWYVRLTARDAKFGLATFVLFEVMQPRTMMASGSAEATAWPHYALGRRHVLQLATGCARSEDEAQRKQNEDEALKIIYDAPSFISGKEHPRGDYLPNFTLPGMDLQELFRGNWGKLREVKGRYDPAGRFREGFFIPPASVQ